jgi:hypothetical protein
MDQYSKNGNGRAVTILPSTPRVLRGASLVHRELNKTQLAVLGANITDGLTRYVQTNQEVAASLGVSQTYINAARRLPPERREAILKGWDTATIAELMNPPHQVSLRGPVIPDMKVSDVDLEQMIRAVGLERALAAAVAVESA